MAERDASRIPLCPTICTAAVEVVVPVATAAVIVATAALIVTVVEAVETETSVNLWLETETAWVGRDGKEIGVGVGDEWTGVELDLVPDRCPDLDQDLELGHCQDLGIDLGLGVAMEAGEIGLDLLPDRGLDLGQCLELGHGQDLGQDHGLGVATDAGEIEEMRIGNLTVTVTEIRGDIMVRIGLDDTYQTDRDGCGNADVSLDQGQFHWIQISGADKDMGHHQGHIQDHTQGHLQGHIQGHVEAFEDVHLGHDHNQ